MAIKVLLAHLVNDSALLWSAFNAKRRRWRGCGITNIVQVHDFGIHDGMTYMVMEFIQGQTLKDRLTALRIKGERMTASEVLALTTELASALDHAHANGLVHRDVKPANILLREAAPTAFTKRSSPTSALPRFWKACSSPRRA